MALQRTYDPRFERIWSAYPKWPTGRSKKEPASRAFAAADRVLRFTEADIEAILANISERLRYCETWQRGNKFGPVGLQVYINQHLWNEPFARIARAPVHDGVKQGPSMWQLMGFRDEQDYINRGGRRTH